jgi:hypothetical protein
MIVLLDSIRLDRRHSISTLLPSGGGIASAAARFTCEYRR